MKTTQQEYNVIDIVKFICALLVVAIHISPLGASEIRIIELSNYAIKHCFARIAVPFFFASSGFFLFRKTDYNNFSMEPVKKYVIKLLKLYAIWTVIYLPLKIKSIISYEKGIALGILDYLRDCVFDGSYDHLWYLPALIFATLIVSFLIYKKVKLKNILLISAVFYAAGLLTQSWFGIIEPLRSMAPALWSVFRFAKEIFVTTRDGLFDGMIFVGIGAYIAYEGFNIPKKKALAGFFISYALLFAESFFVTGMHIIREHDIYIFLVPLTYFAFGLASSWRLPSKSSVFKTLRKLSGLIYFIHMWIKRIIAKLSATYELNIEKTCLFFLVVALISVLLSFAIIKLSEKRHFEWLKKIY